MPEHPDELQYVETFTLTSPREIDETMNTIIGNDNRIVHFTVVPYAAGSYGSLLLVVLYEPLGREELEQRAADHLLNFGVTER